LGKDLSKAVTLNFEGKSDVRLGRNEAIQFSGSSFHGDNSTSQLTCDISVLFFYFSDIWTSLSDWTFEEILIALSDLASETRNSKKREQFDNVSSIDSLYPERVSLLHLPSLFDVRPINVFNELIELNIF
jgi:hypothetical protein